MVCNIAGLGRFTVKKNYYLLAIFLYGETTKPGECLVSPIPSSLFSGHSDPFFLLFIIEVLDKINIKFLHHKRRNCFVVIGWFKALLRILLVLFVAIIFSLP